MKFVFASLICLFVSRSGFAVAANSLDENAYVKLYTEWVNLDKLALERNKALAVVAQDHFRRAQILLSKEAISQQEYVELEQAAVVADLEVKGSEIKIREAENRLSVVKSRVAAGLTDIP